MGSLAGRVCATAGAKLFKDHSKQVARMSYSPALSLLRPAVASPLLTWTLHTQKKFRHLIAAGLQSPPTSAVWRTGLLDAESGAHVGDSSYNNPFLNSFRLRTRRRFRDSRIFLAGPRGGDGAAAVEDSKAREASLATRSLIFKWRLLSVIRTLVLWGLHWLDGAYTRGQECMKPRLERLKMRSEPLRYWAYIACFLFSWLSFAFFCICKYSGGS